jgi:hypothetical protein
MRVPLLPLSFLGLLAASIAFGDGGNGRSTEFRQRLPESVQAHLVDSQGRTVRTVFLLRAQRPDVIALGERYFRFAGEYPDGPRYQETQILRVQ